MTDAPRTVADVIHRMEQVEAQLPATDGVRWFNHLYLQVTRAVAAALTASTFRDPAFMQHLDPIFADLYFAAVDAASGGRDVAKAWVALFERRDDRAVAPVQFALCGMNAHINHDLPIAVVTAYTDLGGPAGDAGPQDGTDRERDYTSVDDILAAVETRVKHEFDTGLAGVLDRVFPRAEDAVAHWSIVRARAAAWSSARVLWSLRSDPPAKKAYLDSLDHLVGFAGRGLLVTA